MLLANLVSILQGALILLVFVQNHPELPQSTRDLALQAAQTAINQATPLLTFDASSTGLHPASTAQQAPGMSLPVGWHTYTSQEYGFSIAYQSDLQINVASTSIPEQPLWAPNGARISGLNTLLTIGANFQVGPLKEVDVDRGSDPSDLASCLMVPAADSADAAIPAPSSTKTINGVSFVTYQWGGFGLAHIENTAYRAIVHGACFSLITRQITDPTLGSEDKNQAAADELKQVVNTFRTL
jgi:hypothetical protein